MIGPQYPSSNEWKKMFKFHRTIASVSVAVTIALVASVGAIGVTAAHAEVQSANTARSVPFTDKYSDIAVLQFLIFGQGPIAVNNPALAEQVVAGRDIPTISNDQLTLLTSQLKAVDPKFHEMVTLGVQKKDAYATRAAIVRLNEDIEKWAPTQNITKSSKPQPCGNSYCLYNTVLVTAGAVLTVVVFVSVACILLALYRFDNVGKDQLRENDWAAQLTRTL